MSWFCNNKILLPDSKKKFGFKVDREITSSLQASFISQYVFPKSTKPQISLEKLDVTDA